MKLFKLTTQDGCTYNGYHYGVVGRVHKKEIIENPKLCSTDVFHAYKDKNLAFLLNPIHANIRSPKLWEIEGDVVCEEPGKVGSFTQTVVRELKIPKWVGSPQDVAIRLLIAKLCIEQCIPLNNQPTSLLNGANYWRGLAERYPEFSAEHTAHSIGYIIRFANSTKSPLNLIKISNKAIKTIMNPTLKHKGN